MATRTFLTVLSTLLSVPFVVFSRIAEATNLLDLRSDIGVCLRLVDDLAWQFPVPNAFIQALVVAEDRRNALHFGVDPIGMIRAAISLVTGNGLQGASTIEQQFVRVATKRYERTIFRKIREQALAIAISRRRSKTELSRAYLCVAFYGHGLVGMSGLTTLCGPALESCSSQKTHQAIARLKYPQPLFPSHRWNRRLVRRATYISRRLHSPPRQPVTWRSTPSFCPVTEEGPRDAGAMVSRRKCRQPAQYFAQSALCRIRHEGPGLPRMAENRGGNSPTEISLVLSAGHRARNDCGRARARS